MPLLASALQRAKKRKAEAAAAKEAAAAAAAAVTAASGDAASCSPSSASSPSTASDAATAVAASGSSSRESAAAAAKAGAKSAAVAVVASSSSSAYAPPALPPLPPPPLSLRGSTLSSFDLGAVLGESPPPLRSSLFFPQSFLAPPPPLSFDLLSMLKREREQEEKQKTKKRHGLVRQSAARPAPRDGASLRSEVALEVPPAAVGTGGSLALREGGAGQPERGAGVREAAGDVPGEFW